jgi:hypothetical protein
MERKLAAISAVDVAGYAARYSGEKEAQMTFKVADMAMKQSWSR